MFFVGSSKKKTSVKGKKPSLGSAEAPKQKQSRLVTGAQKGNVYSRGLECSIYIVALSYVVQIEIFELSIYGH